MARRAAAAAAAAAAACFAGAGVAAAECRLDGSWSGELQLDAAANLVVQWRVSGDVVELGLSASGTGWVGVGLAEDTSGSMIGADVVTVELRDNQLHVQDRHVPWAAFPFAPYSEAYEWHKERAAQPVLVETGPSLFPELDDDHEGCADWELVRGSAEGECLSAVVRRQLTSADPHDRDFTPGTAQRMIWAFGSSDAVAYHAQNRGTMRIDVGAAAPSAEEPTACADCTIDLLFDEFEVPAQTTLYACASFELPDEERSIVKFEPVVDKAAMVHHMIVHSCDGSENSAYAKHVNNPGRCNSPDAATGKGGSILRTPGCASMIFGWAVGGGPLTMPEGVGFRTGSGRGASKYIVIEMHYNNPEGVAGVRDSSGVRLTFSEEVQPEEAAVMLLGDAATVLPEVDAGSAVAKRVSQCPSACTSKFQEPINVFAEFMHMHSFGKRIWTNRFTPEGEFKARSAASISFWNFEFQSMGPVQYQISPGEHINVHCEFDASKWPEAVGFGIDSLDEMCMSFISYWPKQSASRGEINSCGQLGGLPIMLCGNEDLKPLDPELVQDSEDLPEVFGPAETCPARGVDSLPVGPGPSPPDAPPDAAAGGTLRPFDDMPEFVVTWRVQDREPSMCHLDLEVSVPGRRWVGFGLGDGMVDAKIVLAQGTEGDGLEVGQFDVDAKTKAGIVPAETSIDLIAATAAFDSGATKVNISVASIAGKPLALACSGAAPGAQERVVFAFGSDAALAYHGDAQRIATVVSWNASSPVVDDQSSSSPTASPASSPRPTAAPSTGSSPSSGGSPSGSGLSPSPPSAAAAPSRVLGALVGAIVLVLLLPH